MCRKYGLFGIRTPFIKGNYQTEKVVISYTVSGVDYNFPIIIGYNDVSEKNILINIIKKSIVNSDATYKSCRNIPDSQYNTLISKECNVGICILRKIGNVFLDEKPAPSFDCYSNQDGIEIAIEVSF